MKKNKVILTIVFIAFFTLPAFSDIIDTLISPMPMSTSSMPMREFNIKIGIDFDGNYHTDKYIEDIDGKKFDVGNNASFAAEYIKYFNPYIGAGAGISYQIPRELDGFHGKFGFAPLYASLKIRSWPQEPGIYAYIACQAGYNLFYGDCELKPKEGGFYYGIGLGIVYKEFLIEVMRGVNSAIAQDMSKNKINMDYDKFTVSVGYKF